MSKTKPFNQIYKEHITNTLELKDWLADEIAQELECTAGEWNDLGSNDGRIAIIEDKIKEDFIGQVYPDIYDNAIDVEDVRLGNILDCGIEMIAKSIYEDIYDGCKDLAITYCE